MRKRNDSKIEQGQISLLIILVGVIALSVGLAFVSRSITDSRAAVAQQNSQQALAAAEAGVQRAINKDNTLSGVSVGSGTISNVKQYSIGGTLSPSITNPEFLINGGNSVQADEGVDLWMVDHTNGVPDLTQTPYTGGELTIYWASKNDLSGNPTNYGCSSGAIVPALEVITYMGGTKDAKNKITTAISHRYVFDPCVRIPGTSASSITDANGINFNDSYLAPQYQNFKFNYSVTISTTDSLNPSYSTYLIEIIPLYNSSIMGVESYSSVTLPSQGNLYISTGISGDTQRTISYFNGYPQLPMVYSLYSR